MSLPIHTYTELQQQIHGDLRIQHPEWVKPNGESPMCDSYKTCLTKMLDTLTRRRSSESIVPPDGRIGTGVRLKISAYKPRDHQTDQTYHKYDNA
jgi:hypothetical protein